MPLINPPKNLLRTSFKGFSDEILGGVFPIRCGLCAVLGDKALCDYCSAEFEPVTRLRPIASSPTQIVFHYKGRAGQAVRRLKYSGGTCLAEPMARYLEARFSHELELFSEMIVPVPIHWTRRFERGYNQSDLLIQYLPEDRIDFDALRRTRMTRAQASLSVTGRRSNLEGAFESSDVVAGKRVLIVDDVITSGATIDECVKVLKRSGAKEVAALAFAGIP